MTERDYPVPGPGPRYETNMNVVTPTDRLRWGPVWGGLFIALATWGVLTVLGMAIGLSTWDRMHTTGAGIWAGVSAIIAFILGGWFAARTAAVRGESNGLINGIMVWALGATFLFLLFLLAGVGAGSMAVNTPTSSPGERAAPAAAQMSAGQAAADVGEQMTRPETQRTLTRSAWGTFIALLLGLGSAALGGYLGSRTVPHVRSTGEPRPAM